MSSPSILIVDDDPATVESVSGYLDHSGYAVETAESAEKAICILETAKRIDVVIADIRLRGMDGLSMTRRIKESYDANVIIMTGYIEDYSYEDAISKGADDIIFKPFKFEELLLRLKRVLRERELTRERDRAFQKYKSLAITDGLTGLFNSRHFYHQLRTEIERSNRYGYPLSLLVIDIDHFKVYNDCHGHIEGDKVLRKTAELIVSGMRKLDSAYRYGGEEFTVILPHAECLSAMNVAQRIRRQVETCFQAVHDENVTVSIGVTEYAPNETLAEFIDRADKAMYLAKRSGRNRVVRFMRSVEAITCPQIRQCRLN